MKVVLKYSDRRAKRVGKGWIFRVPSILPNSWKDTGNINSKQNTELIILMILLLIYVQTSIPSDCNFPSTSHCLTGRLCLPCLNQRPSHRISVRNAKDYSHFVQQGLMWGYWKELSSSPLLGHICTMQLRRVSIWEVSGFFQGKICR